MFSFSFCEAVVVPPLRLLQDRLSYRQAAGRVHIRYTSEIMQVSLQGGYRVVTRFTAGIGLIPRGLPLNALVLTGLATFRVVGYSEVAPLLRGLHQRKRCGGLLERLGVRGRRYDRAGWLCPHCLRKCP